MPRSISGSNGSRSGEAGFALLLVIWGLALISLIALTVITAGRYRALATANLIENAKAEALAEAGVNLLRADLHAAFASGSLSALPLATNGAPLLCTMQQGALAALTVEDEGGKVDLNSASPGLFRHLASSASQPARWRGNRGRGGSSRRAEPSATVSACFVVRRDAAAPTDI